ncbi:hypothetical protein PR202_ga12486 [Eleusine coracana subsp. coracana]|uniref:Protein kinase domain-containing protein n=1 Tax=Eleusine coracana subsp. coracana TaxID=191504 RepID=A0AAV5CC93_ELECO|nr:hypothetical protein PR202_ga12486 [Eleusine coracana subsp. coracana]
MRASSRSETTAEARPPFCVAGTNGYMAPAADMWSLGCVMAELLADTLMFDDAEQLARIFDVLGVPEDELGSVAAPGAQGRGGAAAGWSGTTRTFCAGWCRRRCSPGTGSRS